MHVPFKCIFITCFHILFKILFDIKQPSKMVPSSMNNISGTSLSVIFFDEIKTPATSKITVPYPSWCSFWPIFSTIIEQSK